MSTSAAVNPGTVAAPESPRVRKRSSAFDLGLVLGLAVAGGTLLAGLSSTGVGLPYFLHPTGAVIVLGGTLGVLFVTTPAHALRHSWRRVVALLSAPAVDRAALLEEIVTYARTARQRGPWSLEPEIEKASHPFLRDALMLVLDVRDRATLQSALEADMRLRERQGEADAKALEVAGGFAPTLGIIGTVVGLIDVLRNFSNISSVGHGVGTAFVSTVYGLALANLVLLPLSHRIRARVAETFEIQELIAEGVLCLVDQLHPTLIRLRLASYIRTPDTARRTTATTRGEVITE